MAHCVHASDLRGWSMTPAYVFYVLRLLPFKGTCQQARPVRRAGYDALGLGIELAFT